MDFLDPLDLLDPVVALVKLDQLDLLDLPDPLDLLDHPVVDSTLASLLHPRRKPLILSVTTALMMPM
ncbi:hypothetical protein D3Z50_22990 [Clostridiaceae bacterium]|nr:hypothetical protein [Clostridiaceae bacterium]